MSMFTSSPSAGGGTYNKASTILFAGNGRNDTPPPNRKKSGEISDRTTDSRTTARNTRLAIGSSGDEVVFAPNLDDAERGDTKKVRTPGTSPSRKPNQLMDVDDRATAQTMTNTEPTSKKEQKAAWKAARTTRRAARTGYTGAAINIADTTTYPVQALGSSMWRHKTRTLLAALAATGIFAPSGGDINRNLTGNHDLVPFDSLGNPPEAIIQGGKFLPWSYIFTDGFLKGSSVHIPVSKMKPDNEGNSVVVGGYNNMFKNPSNKHYKGTIDKDGNSFTESDRAIGFVRGSEKDGLMRTYQNRWGFETNFVSPDGKVRGWPAKPGKATYGFKALGNTGPERAQIYLTENVPGLVPGITYDQFQALWEKVPPQQRGNVTKAVAALAHRFHEAW